MTLQEEITRRRTFAVIAHPDAGKTTLTEKLLLFGGAIHVAGAVKSNKIKKGATSDFMEIERQRGISVATAVMGFEYLHVVSQFAERSGCGSTAQARTYDDNIQFAFVGRAYYLDRRLVVAPLLREFPGGYF